MLASPGQVLVCSFNDFCVVGTQLAWSISCLTGKWKWEGTGQEGKSTCPGWPDHTCMNMTCMKVSVLRRKYVENYFLLETMYTRPSELQMNSGAELRSEWTKTQDKRENPNPLFTVLLFTWGKVKCRKSLNRDERMYGIIKSHPVLSCSSRAILSLQA